MTRHQWKWLNGFWAECNCGHRDSGYSQTLLRRRMDRHVREANEYDLRAALNRIRGLGLGDPDTPCGRGCCCLGEGHAGECRQ